MKLLLCSTVLWLAAACSVFSQTKANIRETIFYAKNGNPDWLTMRTGVQLGAADLVRQHLRDLGLTEHDELRLLRVDADPLGFLHYRYQQFHRGLPVEGAELLMHEQNGRVRTLNGKLALGLELDVRPQVAAGDALKKALLHIPAQRYMWEVEAAETLLRRIKNDPAASFYPKPELVLVSPGFELGSAELQLAWRIEIYAEKPSVRKELFVSAIDGSILEEADLLHDQNTPGTAETRYSGTKQIITDSLASDLFRLVETTRGNGIETYNMRGYTEYVFAVDFLDDNNNWNNVNPEQDEVATDAHWGAEMTYDYFLQKHNHAGVDGFDMALISFVHFDQNWSNASWTGDWARFGDGNGSSWGPLTSLDVVGHEFAHGVTQFTANLRYRNESGALNESFSDIFGTAIEFWADPDQSDWLIGEDFVKSGPPLRNMADPKKEDNPDTYKGEHWVTGTNDNGGVHTNSGVQNHWFYLLTAGGQGTNDNNADYSVNALGLDTAAAIAFRNLKYYLARLSDYADAREGSLQAAEDLYGPCSAAYQETARAWHAVGVGKPPMAYDLKALGILEPNALSCGLSGAEPVTVQFRYLGCNADLAAGDKIPFAYQVENHPVVWDTFTLAAPLVAGDIINFTFSVPPTEFATPGAYHLRCWTAYGADLEPDNNTASLLVVSLPEQESDLRMQNLEHPASNCTLGLEQPEIEIGFWGCEPLPAGTEINLFYQLNGGAPIAETVQVPFTLNTGDSYRHTFSEASDFSALGHYSLDAWVQFGPDTLTANDSLFELRIVNPARLTRSKTLTFEAAANSLDSLFALTTPNTRGELSATAARTGAAGFRITGGDVALALLVGEAQIATAENVWTVNESFRSRLCICADLSGFNTAELQFDLKQTFSLYYFKTLGYNVPYASAVRVLVEGDQISPTYKPITHSLDSWKTPKFDLGNFLGNTVEICFETHTGISPELDTYGSKGDQVLLDNIAIVGQGVSAAGELSGAEPDWKLMPNPGKGRFTIDFRAREAQTLSITVFNALGQAVRSLHTSVGAGANLIPIDLEGEAAGLYFVQLSRENERYVRRLAIQN